MATTKTTSHTPNTDREMRQYVEMANSSSQIAAPCSCGKLHPVRHDDSIDTTLGYNPETKEFEALHEHEGRFIFLHEHPYKDGKL